MVSGLDTIFGGDSQSSTVPPVSPEDLKSVWAMQTKNQALFPGQQIMMPADAFKQACRAGADVRAVFERVSKIGYLQMAEVLTPWLQDGVPNDAVFDVLATIPMTRMQVGVVYNEPPFDIDEFLKQVEQRTEN
jgi:hypothetical protein